MVLFEIALTFKCVQNLFFPPTNVLVGYLVVMGKVQLSCGNEMCQLWCVCVLIRIKYRINKIKANVCKHF